MQTIIRNARQIVCAAPDEFLVDSGDSTGGGTSISTTDGVVATIGPTSSLRAGSPDSEIIDATGKTVIPGFIDSHTHLVFAGSRENEFEQRLRGLSYQEIAARGGGINATVQRVRQSSKEELKRLARRRLDRLLSFGVTTVEVKSGYGLSLADEIKCLEVIAELDA